MGSPFIFNGNFAKSLKSFLNLNDQIYILSGTNDPSSVATNAPEGSIYSRTSTGRIYVKTDAGSSTNWSLVPNTNNPYVWSTITSGTTAVSGQALITNSGSQLSIALPAGGSKGDYFKVAGYGAGGWAVTATNTQRILAASGDTVMGGSVAASDPTASADLVFIDPSASPTVWSVVASRGTLTVTQGAAAFGYFVGGFTTLESTKIERLQFSNETRTTISAVLSVAKYYNCGLSSATKGYSLGGDNSTANQLYNTIEALTFNGESTATVSATIGTATERAAGVYSILTAGYFMGGNTNRASPAAASAIYKLLYSNDSTSTLAATLDTARFDNAGGSGPLKGYSFCGFTSGESNTIEDLNFSNDTSVAISTTSSQSKHALSCVQSTSAAYPAGGSTGSLTTRIEKFIFSGETISTLAATLDTAKRDMCGVSGGSKGYYGGGDTGSFTTVIEDMNFSNDTSAAISAVLGTATAYMAGVQGG